MVARNGAAASVAIVQVRRLAVYVALAFAGLIIVSWTNQTELANRIATLTSHRDTLKRMIHARNVAEEMALCAVQVSSEVGVTKTFSKKVSEYENARSALLRSVQKALPRFNILNVEINELERESTALVQLGHRINLEPNPEARIMLGRQMVHDTVTMSAGSQKIEDVLQKSDEQESRSITETRIRADYALWTACVCACAGLLFVLSKCVVPALKRARESEEQLTRFHEELSEANAKLEVRQGELEGERSKLQTALDDMEIQMALHGHAARRFQSLFDGLPVGCFTVDTSGTVFEMNPTMGELIGRSAHLCLLGHAGQLFGQDDRTSEIMEIIGHLGEEVAPDVAMWPVTLPTGESRLLQMHFLPLRNHQAEVVGMICCAVDLTKRHEAEQALSRSESRMRILLEHAPTSIALFDTSLHLHVATQQWLEDNGLVGRDLADQTVFELIPELKEIWQESVEQALTGDAVWAEDDLLLRPDGRVQWLNWELRPWSDSDGVVNGIVAFVEDMTGRREIEQRVRDSEERFDLAVQALSVGIWDWNLITNEMFWSPRLEQMLGLEQSDNLRPQKEFFGHVHPDDEDALAKLLQSHLAWKLPFTMEARFQHSEGHYLWLHLRGQAIWSEGGRATRMVGSVDDITERKAFELRVVESEQRFRDVVDAAGEYIWECDSEFKYTFVSDRFFTTTGLDQKAAIGLSVSEIFAPHEQERVSRLLDTMLSLKKGFSNIVLQAQHADGSVVWQRLNAVPILNAAGDPVGFRGAGLDVTYQRLAEDALMEANERTRSLLESIRDCFVSIDRDYVFTYANQAAERELGQDGGSITGYQAWEVFPQVLHGDMKREFVEAGESDTVHVYVGHVPDSNRWFEYRINPTKSGFSVFFVDITEKRLLDQLIAKQMDTINESNVLLEAQQVELQEANIKLQTMALTDGLTCIANRKALQQHMDECFSMASQGECGFSVIMMDVDHFKKYNDTYGHLEGDDVLKQVAQLVSDAVGDRGFVARYGGEEFAVVLSDMDLDQSCAVAEDVRAAIESWPWPLREVTVSVGVACYEGDVGSPSKVIAKADEALYVSKQSGRNRVTRSEPGSKAA